MRPMRHELDDASDEPHPEDRFVWQAQRRLRCATRTDRDLVRALCQGWFDLACDAEPDAFACDPERLLCEVGLSGSVRGRELAYRLCLRTTVGSRAPRALHIPRVARTDVPTVRAA